LGLHTNYINVRYFDPLLSHTTKVTNALSFSDLWLHSAEQNQVYISFYFPQFITFSSSIHYIFLLNSLHFPPQFITFSSSIHYIFLLNSLHFPPQFITFHNIPITNLNFISTEFRTSRLWLYCSSSLSCSLCCYYPPHSASS
jgi:hypothetical protein